MQFTISISIDCEAERSELDALGYRDMRGAPGLVIVEWPERGGGGTRRADLQVNPAHRASARRAARSRVQRGDERRPGMAGRIKR